MKDKLTTYSIVLISLILIISLIPLVGGHSPSNMELDYSADNSELDVTITHSVADIDSHYIERVEVYKNDELVASEDYTSQPSEETFTYTYYGIQMEDGDTIIVRAYCSISGSITEELSSDGNSNGEDDTPFIGVGSVIIFLTLSAVLYSIITKRKKR